MPGLGTIINTAAIVVGGLLGLLFKNLLTKSMEDTLLKASSVCVLFIGIGGAMQHMLKITDGALETSGSMMLIICFVLGSIVGELLDIEGAFERFGAWLRKKTHNESDTGFLSAFIHASLTVCIGAMAIVGSIQDGLLGDSSLLCAKAALDAADGNVLDAIIWLESQGKTQATSAHAATESAPVDEPSAEMVAAQAAYEKSSEKTDFSKKMDSVWEYLKKLFRLSLDTKFIATRRDAIILNIPILIPIVALFAWGATIWLMLIGLFFGMRYRIDSDGDVPGSINNLMNHAADAADDIKQNLNDDK